MNPDTDKAARELLAFYLEAGVDAPVGEKPVDRFADDTSFSTSPFSGEVGERSPTGGGLASSPESKLPPSPTLPRPNSGLPDLGTMMRDSGKPEARGGGSQESHRTVSVSPLAPDAASLAAHEAVKGIATLEDLRAALAVFEGCALKGTATQLVFADGNPQAKIMFVGEAPGRDEDIEGLPFVGRSGKLLDRMLSAISLDRSSVYIANIIPWRPPGNRTPTPQESQICLPFIQRQIELVDPDILVCLGGPSAQTLLGIREGITKMRGRWFSYHTGKREIRAMATFHPAFLLRSPLQKRLAWRDFLAIKKALGI
ncbi:MAG: uracil-DNA glycosylase [Alphaproteobacteria bacterium]|nr:uracil-DNA glycosylase [Alphaproteobacteria bacterium]